MAVLGAALVVVLLQGVWSSPLETGVGADSGVASGKLNVGTGLRLDAGTGASFGARTGGGAGLNADLVAGLEGGFGGGTGHGVKIGFGGRNGINAVGQALGNSGIKANLEMDGSASDGNLAASLGDLSAGVELNGGQTGKLGDENAVIAGSGGGLELNLDTSAYIPFLTALLGAIPQGNLNMGLNGNAAGTGLSLTPGVGINMDYSGYRLGDLTAAGMNSAGNMAKLPFEIAESVFNGLRSGALGLRTGGVGLGAGVKSPSLQTSVEVPAVGMNVGVPGVGMNFGIPGVGMNIGVPGVGMNVGVPGVGMKLGGSGSSSGHLAGLRSILPSFSFSTGSNAAPTNPK